MGFWIGEGVPAAQETAARKEDHRNLPPAALHVNGRRNNRITSGRRQDLGTLLVAGTRHVLVVPVTRHTAGDPIS